MLKKVSIAVAAVVAIVALLWAIRSPGALADTASAWQAYRAGKYEAALKELKALAEGGDAGAQYYLGTLYSDGKAVKRDYRQAAEWYGKAASRGYGDAEFTLGFLYLTGAGEGASAVPADRQLATKWLKIAAAKGYVAAQSALAMVYGEGYGVARDTAEAQRWAEPAATRGDAAAQYELGRLKAQTLTVESWGEAYTWFRLAEKQGYPGAAENRAVIGKQIDAQALAAAERRADTFVPVK
jgi:TPR repeat protein